MTMTTREPATEMPLPGSMAEGIALQRFAESMLPEGIRIFSDPLAVRFVNPAIPAFARDHPAEATALAGQIEQAMPGWSNAIRLRIRYFDDAAAGARSSGFTQLVILGAGYDTRAFRIGTLGEGVRIFEIDRPGTLERKTRILTETFGKLPGRVAYIPLDMAERDPWKDLAAAGWSREAKTLFFLEGLVMYLPPQAVRSLFAGIARNAGAGSALLFDFVPQFMADGSADAEGSGNIRTWTIRAGEPILSGFRDGEVAAFLPGLGYTGIRVIPSRELAGMYFTGPNARRNVSGLMSLVYAALPGGGRQ